MSVLRWRTDALIAFIFNYLIAGGVTAVILAAPKVNCKRAGEFGLVALRCGATKEKKLASWFQPFFAVKG